MSEDLSDVEEFLFGDDEDEDEDGCCCGHDGEDEFSVVCPACDAELTLDDDDLRAGVLECPNCGETLELEFDECDDDCCCEEAEDDDEETDE